MRSKIFGPKRAQGTGEWKRLHKKELHHLHSSPNIIRVIKSSRMRWAGHVARMWERRGTYRVVVGKPEVKSPLGKPRPRVKGAIKIDLQ